MVVGWILVLLLGRFLGCLGLWWTYRGPLLLWSVIYPAGIILDVTEALSLLLLLGFVICPAICIVQVTVAKYLVLFLGSV